MTAQTVWKVELGELSAIEVSCSHCKGASVSIPLSGIATFARSMKCPGCNETWWNGFEDQTFKDIAMMAQSIDSLKRSGSKLFTLQFPVIGVEFPHEDPAR